jgi:hypothetical protein
MVFENTVLRKIFGPKRDEVTGQWRRLHNEELNDLYPSIKVTISNKIRWTGNVARDERFIQVFVGNLREREHLEDSDVDGRIIFRWIFRKWDVGAWSGLIWIRIGTGGGYL